MSSLERIGRDRGAYFRADELVDTTFPDPRWAVHGLVSEGLTLLAGAPKLGKSWLALGLGVSIASGGRALGRIDAEPGDVLYCALEDTPRRLQHRLGKMLAGDPAPARLTLVTALPEMPQAADLIAEWLDEHPNARLVVVDVLGKVRPPQGTNGDRYENDYRVISALKRLADNYSVAVIVVTHTRKMGATDAFDTVSGSTGLTGAADTTMVMQRARGDTTAALHVTGRDVEESEYALTFDPLTGRWALDGSALADAAARASAIKAANGLGADAARIVEYVNGRPDGTRSADIVRDLGLTDDVARQYLHRAEKAGRVAKLDRGLYGPVTSVTTVTDTDEGRDARDACDTCGRALDDWLIKTGERFHVGCAA
jgi:hypothetical protein